MSNFKLRNFDPEAVMVRPGGMFHLWCCDCKLRHTVFTDVENHKGKDFVVIGLQRDDGATNLAREVDNIVLYQRKGGKNAKKTIQSVD